MAVQRRVSVRPRLSPGLAGSFAVALASIEANKERNYGREQWDVMANFRYSLAP